MGIKDGQLTDTHIPNKKISTSKAKINTGSYYSVYNDTDEDLWVWDGVNTDAILYPTMSVLTVASLGAAGGAFLAGGAATAAGTAASSALASGVTSSAGMAAAAAVASAATATAATAGAVNTSLTVVGWICTASAGTISAALGITSAEAEKLKSNIKYFRDNCNRKLRPGDTHSSGKLSLSLVRTVWLMSDKTGEQVQRACWTGAADGETIE